MPTITTYDTKTGQLYCVMQGPADLLSKQVPNGLGYIEGNFFGETHWFDLALKAVVERPSMPLFIQKTRVVCNGGDVATIAGLPVPCLAKVDGREILVDDGTVELTFDEPGKHTITLSAWPYLDHTVEITAYED